MKKRLTSFLIALLMVATAFASCASNDNGNDTGDSTAETQGDGTTANEQNGDDNFAGTPAYIVEGDYIIVDGVKYPNNNNFNCGPLLATDDLDRTLPTAEETKAYDESKAVGIFYFLWMGEHGDSGAYNISAIIESDKNAAKKASYYEWGPEGAMHHWGEPLYGYYYSSDKWVMRKHVEELTNAGVDFLFFDVTNGYPYISNAKAIMRILSDFNSQGYDAPQVVFYTHSNAGNAAKNIYNNIYKKGVYEDTWYKIDGKPVIIGPESELRSALGSDADFFTYRDDQWPNEPKETNAWPWMSFGQWDSDVFYDKNGKAEAINVSVAQHNATVRFSDSAIYGNRFNQGRSFRDGRQNITETSYLYGYNFQSQWDAAINSDATVVLVTGWNEWVAQRQAAGANDEVIFVDCCNVEFSRDVEMMKGGYFDNYYMQLISNIRKYKGTAPTLVQNTRKKIDINGSFDQWDDILVTYSDYAGDTADRNGKAFGNTRQKDSSGRNDLYKMKIVYDTTNIYFYVETATDDDGNATPITDFDTNSTWMQLFINIDNATTGWYGYDYIVNYKANSSTETTLAKCTETGKEFKFEEASKVNYRVEGNKMMISVPLSELGITDYNKINFSFKWVDSNDTVTTMEQMYTSGDSAPHGRLNFVFQNYK